VVTIDASDAMDFDLRPPAPRSMPPSIEKLSEALFSGGHFHLLLRRPRHLARFTAFLVKYRPEYYPLLFRYLEMQKAVKAVEYANAVAAVFPPPVSRTDYALANSTFAKAASLDKAFEEASASFFQILVGSALPMYITYNLVKIVRECLIDELTGRETPLTQGLVGGLSEAFCITDPHQQDDPIVYASEEFYRLTGYGPDDVMGRNCRFLQGAKTKREAPTRLRESIQRGEEISETVLNYRRDGRPFINLLMIAPLRDDQGNIKYHMGAQIDVTGLVEGGKGLGGFEHFLETLETERRKKEASKSAARGDEETERKQKALGKLRELSEMFDPEEHAVVPSSRGSTLHTRDKDEHSIASNDRRRATRRVLADSDRSGSASDEEEGMEEEDEETEAEDSSTVWKLGRPVSWGFSGKFPSVYDSYMLIRPAPSLRIIFLSPKVSRRLGNVLQHPFLSHVAAPAATLAGLKKSFGTGTPVSAKLTLMLTPGERRDGTATGPGVKPEDGRLGQACWISATPLYGSDDRIGVWMIVMVEKSHATSARPSRGRRNGTLTAHTPDVSRSLAERLRNLDIPSRSSSQQGHRSSPSQEEPLEKDVRHQGEPVMGSRGLEDLSGSAEHVRPPPYSMPNPAAVTLEDLGLDRSEQDQGRQLQGISAAPGGNTALTQNNEIEEGFVRPQEAAQFSDRPESSHGRSDSEGPQGASPTQDLAMAQEPASADSRSTSPKGPISPPELEKPPSMNSDAHVDDGSSDRETEGPKVTRAKDQEPADTSFSLAQPSATRRAKPAGTLYIDYFCHPGSRSSGEYNRRAVSMSGSGADWLLPTRKMQTDNHLGQAANHDGEEWSDIECTRSPYSVD